MLIGFVIAISLISVLIGLVVILKNAQDFSSRVLFLHSIAVGFWISTNYLSNENSLGNEVLLLMNHLVLFFGLLGTVTLNMFVEVIGGLNQGKVRKKIVLYSIALIALILSLTPYVISDIQPGEPIVEIIFGFLAPIYFVVIAFFMVRLFWMVSVAIRRSSGIRRSRLQAIGAGIYIAFGILVVTNVAMPFVLGEFGQSLIAPTIFVLMVGTIAYSIIRQQLFNIRGTVVRGIGYVLTILILLLIYNFIFISLARVFRGSDSVFSSNVATYIFLIFAIISFQPLRSLAERLTSRVFYRDRYDSQEVIDKISDVLVLEALYEKKLLRESFGLLYSALRVQFIGLSREENNNVDILAGKKSKDLVGIKVAKIYENPIYVRKDATESELDIEMSRQSIEVLMHLGTKNHQIGVVYFGPKLSGGSYSKQDVALLSTVRKNLSISIENARNYKEISRFAEVLSEEVSSATKVLRRTNSDLKSMSVAKDEFISMAAHQIRPQLTAVRGFLDLLSKSKIDVSQKELVDWSVSGVERMIRIITDMLNLSRITSGEFKVRLQRVSLLNMVQNELLAMEPLLRTSGVEVITEFVEDDAEVMGDDIKLREVMSNLLSNSVQYSPKKGKIKVKVYFEDNGWVFAVRDYGIGVDEKSRGKLFQKFFRTSAATDLRPSGTGVGLFLARKVIDEHNGKVFYKMPQEGQGSVFGFWLPAIESVKKS